MRLMETEAREDEMLSEMQMQGRVKVQLIRAPGPGWRWKLRNNLRPGFIWGWLTVQAAKVFSRLTGVPSLTSELMAMVVRADGRRINYGVLSRRVITDTGVGFLVDAWQGAVEPEIMRYHGCGTGTGDEGAGETALGAECTTVLNPDNTRATGTLAEGASANIFSTVATVAFDDTAAVTEHGLFSQAATGGGVLFDRSKFSAINVVSGDSIQFTYQCTFNSGG
jgi:hypothetical protein